MARRPRKDYCIQVDNDGLPARQVGAWAKEKYTRVGMLADVTATGTKDKWEARVYVDLYAGSGYSRIRGSRGPLFGSPLIALSVRDPFDRYIFCESDPEALSALKIRVSRHFPAADVRYVAGDVNERVDLVVREIPQHQAGYRVLSFCFVDPFSVGIRFETIRTLANGRAIDFLILLALGMDANRNIGRYVKPQNTQIDDFLGTTDWRPRWAQALARGEDFIYFLAREYAGAMERLKYLPTLPADMHPVRSDLKNLPLYYLAFFSKRELGMKFWKEVQKYSPDQLGLGF